MGTIRGLSAEKPSVQPLSKLLRQLSSSTLAVLAFLLAGLLMVGVAFAAALVIESRTEKVVSTRLATAGIDWVTLDPDGLRLNLTGTAPNEAARYRIVNLVSTLIESSRVRDQLDVVPASAIQAPDFSVQMLRTEDGIQLIGLVPETPGEDAMTEEALAEAAAALSPNTELTNLLETADYPAPATWGAALAFGLEALGQLERSKISVGADLVEITAISDSADEKRALEDDFRAMAPDGVQLILDISAPRPVITPFTFRIVMDADGARFDSCSADSERARAQILAAAVAAGIGGRPLCTIGIGTPTPRWSEAVVLAISKVAELGSASITFSDSDVTLLAGPEVTQAAFDKVVGELETALPDAFSLTSTLEKPAAAVEGPAEFTATLSEEGKVVLRGRLTDSLQRDAVDAFARAAFEGAEVLTATRLDTSLPDGWPLRVLTGLEALAELDYGTLLVRADTVEVTGATGSLEARGRITQILSGKLGQGKTFRVNVRYEEALDPVASLPTPEECAADVNAAIAQKKITFTPASAELAIDARPVLDGLAEILNACPPMLLEIGGHTDSQGSEDSNKALSQARAETVLLALQGRRVDISGMTAVGFGETKPIADNETEEGREANRRIEFVMQGPQPLASGEAEGEEIGPPPAPDEPVADTTSEASETVDDTTIDPEASRDDDTTANPPPDGERAAAPLEGTADAAAAPIADPVPDFSSDTGPSVAPTEKTIRPLPRPAGLGVEEAQ